MQDGTTEIAGLIIHSEDPLFLTIVGVHLLAGLSAVTAGLIAIFSPKGRGRHAQWGNIYFWSLSGVFASATLLALLRGPEDLHLFALGAAAFASAWAGRSTHRRGSSLRLHLVAMGLSYVLLLTAFYVETGDQLPLWRLLPPAAFWILPTAVGLPIIILTLLRHPLIRRSGGQ